MPPRLDAYKAVLDSVGNSKPHLSTGMGETEAQHVLLHPFPTVLRCTHEDRHWAEFKP